MSVADFFIALREYLVAWGVVLALLTVLEMLSPRERHSLRTRIFGISYWGLSIALSLLLTKGLSIAWRFAGVEPLFALPRLDLPASPLITGIAAGIMAAAVHDFFFYWYHRAQHRWLWRWHAVHHSVRHLNAVNSYHHISESIFSLLLIQVPTTLLLSDTNPTLPIVTAVLWCHIVWIHSPTRFTLGPLRAVFVDNCFHRIHHSLEDRHFDKNFGAFTTIWDRLFGTCHMPASDEWPAVGLEGVDEPKGLADWVALPLRLPKPPLESGPSIGTPTTGAFAPE